MNDAHYILQMRIIGAAILFLAFIIGALLVNALEPKYLIWREKRRIARRDRERARKRDEYALLYWPRPARPRRPSIQCVRCREHLTTVSDALTHRCIGTYEDMQ